MGKAPPEIYYDEATVLAMRGNVQAALKKLQQAYDHGFRERWLLALDWRLDSIRNQAPFIDLNARMGRDIDRAMAEIRSTQLAAN